MAENKGLLADYGIDADEIPDISYDVPDGVYRFEVGNLVSWEDGDTGRRALRFEFLLDDEEGTTGQKSEWFGLPEDPDAPTDDEMQTLSRMKSRIKSLGVPADAVGSVGHDDLVGRTGTLQLISVAGKGRNKGKTYQNIRNVRPDDEWQDVGVVEQAAPTSKPKAKAAAEDEESEAQPARAARPTTGKAAAAKKNPFANK